MTELSSPSKMLIVALINCDSEVTSMLEHCALGNVKLVSFKNGIELLNKWNDNDWHISAIVSQSEVMAPSGVSLLETLKNQKEFEIPFLFSVKTGTKKFKELPSKLV